MKTLIIVISILITGFSAFLFVIEMRNRRKERMWAFIDFVLWVLLLGFIFSL